MGFLSDEQQEPVLEIVGQPGLRVLNLDPQNFLNANACLRGPTTRACPARLINTPEPGSGSGPTGSRAWPECASWVGAKRLQTGYPRAAALDPGVDHAGGSVGVQNSPSRSSWAHSR
ncbi:MAG: hypothetical protein ACK53L_09275, partial [Pirellulaceae bacterium]